LPEQTHALMQQASERYGLPIGVYFPDAAALEDLIRNQGTNGFYRSVPLRKACCDVRKVEPLGRALAGKKAWVTGLRRAQATNRQDIGFESFDAGNGLAKFNPLADWSDKEVWHYIHARQVPYNALHDQGYASIGCAPCTRAITPGEDPRAGRWWWEQAETRECGLQSRVRAATP
jgi:phosphoadenosine phosphosulfate reductase